MQKPFENQQKAPTARLQMKQAGIKAGSEGKQAIFPKTDRGHEVTGSEYPTGYPY